MTWDILVPTESPEKAAINPMWDLGFSEASARFLRPSCR